MTPIEILVESINNAFESAQREFHDNAATMEQSERPFEKKYFEQRMYLEWGKCRAYAHALEMVKSYLVSEAAEQEEF